MKKWGIIIAILGALVLAACASTGSLVDEMPGERLDILRVDVSKFPAVRNANPFTKRFDDFILDLSAVLPEEDAVNWAYFNRFVVRVQYFDANRNPIANANDLGMMTLVYDLAVIERPGGRGGDPGVNVGNAAQKQFNVMGGWTTAHTRGCIINLRARPAGLILQNAADHVRFIEIKEIIFYNDDMIEIDY
ncbi:MAG: hypothetical protein FWD14_01430 [Treponema sp.]|nr:hypothetical protein [Treponema sp.]